MLSSRVLHADQTPVAMLYRCRGKTRRAYARGAFDAVPGVLYEFCPGRGA